MHRSLATAALLATLALPLGASALATTDETKFDRLIDKVAPTGSSMFVKFKPRLACACLMAIPPIAGVILQDGTGRIVCGLPTFDGSGNLSTVVHCDNYEVLGR